MDNIALIVALLAFVDFLFYFFTGGVAAAKKQDDKKEGSFKRAFIALVVFLAGLITFGITTEPVKQPVDEPRQEQQK